MLKLAALTRIVGKLELQSNEYMMWGDSQEPDELK